MSAIITPVIGGCGAAYLHHFHAHFSHRSVQLGKLDQLISDLHYFGRFLKSSSDFNHSCGIIRIISLGLNTNPSMERDLHN